MNENENGNDKVESLKLFQTLTEAVGARATLQAMLGNLNNEELNRYLKACYGFTTLMTTDAACELLKRFKTAKKNKKAFRKNGYCGFRNFDRMCPALTGYSSKQIRNYAAGYKTPPKAAKSVVHLTTDEIKAREARQKAQAGIDATAAENRLARR